jgi:predicted MPP superfamily phosphohydrolase
MHFSSFGTTINSHEIVDAITGHGIRVFHISEIHLKPYVCRKSACNLADIMAIFRQSGRHYIVGIEIKEWNVTVNPKLAMEYLETYRNTCEYFYLAAKKFSKSTWN